MEDLLAILIFKGYLIFFFWILVNRLGVPLPATPALLGAGALVAMGHWRVSLVLLLAVGATLASDVVWFELGRRYGRSVLRIFCRFTLQPEASARRAEQYLARHGAFSLLFSKFIPGMNRTVLPLTGTAQIGYGRFLIFDFFGALVWAGAYSGVGYLFNDTLSEALQRAQSLGWYALGALLLSALIVVAIKMYAQRQRRGAAAMERIRPQPVGNLLRIEEPAAPTEA